MDCVVTGIPEPYVRWYKDDIDLQQSERIEITANNQLRISELSSTDSGFYKCEAKNSHSDAHHVIEVNIQSEYFNFFFY